MSDSYVSKHKFVMHSAHKRIGVSSALAALKACDVRHFATPAENSVPLRVCLLGEAPTYESAESLAALQHYLAERHNVEYRQGFQTTQRGSAVLENLDNCDCILWTGRASGIERKQIEQIKRYCRRGGGIVAVHTGDVSEDRPDSYDEVFGGSYAGHYGRGWIEVNVAASAENHPLLAGVGPFVSHGPLCRHSQIDAAAVVLFSGTCRSHTEPVAWIRTYHGGRVFYTSLGQADDFRCADFLGLLSNALSWTCRRRP